MKLIHLALIRIGGYIKHYRLVFILFFLGAVISSFVFTYFYGNTQFLRNDKTENSFLLRLFEVYLPENQPIQPEQLHLLDEYGISEVELRHTCVLPEETLERLPPGVPTYVTSFLYNLEKEGNGPLFSPEALTQGRLIVDKAYGEGVQSLTIDGQDFPVMDTVTHGMGVIYAPIQFFMEEFGSVYYLSFQTETILSREDMEAAYSRLQEAFPDAGQIIAPSQYIEVTQDLQTSGLARNALTYVVSLLSFLFLFKYMLDCSKLENVVSYIVGANKRSVFAILTLETILLSAAASLCAILIHAAFYTDVFSRWNQSDTPFTYTALDYGVILLSTVVLALITTLPFLFASLRNTPVHLKGIYEE